MGRHSRKLSGAVEPSLLTSGRAAPTNRRPAKKRPIDKKETRHWLDAVTTSVERIGAVFGAPRITFLLGREGDSAAMLCALAATKHDFIVRGNWDRTVRAADGCSWKVRTLMGDEEQLGSDDVELAGGPGRAARVANVTLRAVDGLVPLKDPTTGKRREVKGPRSTNAREVVSCPTGEEPLDWLLLTNLRVENFTQARTVVFTYAPRWRIEEFHRPWKSGHCNVEDSQLRSEQALLHELRFLKRRSKKKTETIPDSIPTIAQATLRLAELGGYTGKSSGGPPGTLTISRGLAKLRSAADAITAFLAADDEENG